MMRVLVVGAALAGCGGDPVGDHDHDHDHPDDPAEPGEPGTTDPFANCNPRQAVTLRFDATVDGAPVACGSYPWEAPEAVEIADFRLYVSNVVLLDAYGLEHPVELVQDGRWQAEDVVLLDYEDATGACVATGTAETNALVLGTVEGTGPFTGVAFDVGVPHELNHQDVTTAPSPLNLPAMFWSWQSGYKFVSIDLVAGAAPWFVHLGSTGCASSDPLEPPSTECAFPNRARIRLDGADPLATAVELDLARLLADADLTVDAGMPGCMSQPGDVAECTPVFASLGLDFATGDCLDDTAACEAQTAFGWAAP